MEFTSITNNSSQRNTLPNFQLIQGYKCQKFRHHTTTGKSLHEVCTKRSEHHPISRCHSETHKCTGCKGEHPVWHHDRHNRISTIQNLTTHKCEAPICGSKGRLRWGYQNASEANEKRNND